MMRESWQHLQNRLQTFEAFMIRRENVIRFLVGRLLLMGAMVASFWLTMRASLRS